MRSSLLALLWAVTLVAALPRVGPRSVVADNDEASDKAHGHAKAKGSKSTFTNSTLAAKNVTSAAAAFANTTISVAPVTLDASSTTAPLACSAIITSTVTVVLAAATRDVVTVTQDAAAASQDTVTATQDVVTVTQDVVTDPQDIVTTSSPSQAEESSPPAQALPAPAQDSTSSAEPVIPAEATVTNVDAISQPSTTSKKGKTSKHVKTIYRTKPGTIKTIVSTHPAKTVMHTKLATTTSIVTTAGAAVQVITITVTATSIETLSASAVIQTITSPPQIITSLVTVTESGVQSETSTLASKAGGGAKAANPPGKSSTNATTTAAGIVSVSRAGGVLNPTAAAEANVRDNTAVRAFTSVSIKAANGQCLFVDPTAGDFRKNLIPVQLKACTGSLNERWDFITKGTHNNAVNSTLIVSSITAGCLNFDPRRAAGDTVIIFSCGGRADGTGQTTTSQLFPFDVGGADATTAPLAPENGNGKTCLVGNASSGRLDSVACDGTAGQEFSLVANKNGKRGQRLL